MAPLRFSQRRVVHVNVIPDLAPLQGLLELQFGRPPYYKKL
jgi:hypothetical protein